MKRFLPLLIFLILSAGLIFSWFRYGLIYGGGDVGLQTYNPKRILENARFVWWDSTAPGAPIPQGLSAIPFQFILFLLQQIGFSPLLLQASLFLTLLFLMGFGMYMFIKYKLEHLRTTYAVLGGLFYMLNPYMMVQVWHRFIHTTIMLAAALPFLAIFWDSWIKKGSVKYLVFFLITSFLAVYIFGTFAFIVTVWIFLSFLTLSHFFPWKKTISFKLSGRFLFGLFVWILINFWHLYPVAKLSPAVLSEQHKSSESIVTLINISAQAILPYSLQFANPFYLFEQTELGPIYKNPLFQTLPWIFVAVILVGLINSFKIKSIPFYGILFLISVFLVKGAAPPFGNLYIFGFNNIFALGVLRNPFEKTGLILIFFSTILFVVGLMIISNFLKDKINDSAGKITVILILLSVVIFAWPMFAGKIIGRYDKPAYVEVPESYKQADRWFAEQNHSGMDDGKILHLPLTRGESVQYNWKYGYNGLEPSDTFFTSFPSISRGFNISRTDDSLTALSLIFYKPFSEDKSKILSLLQAFNVKFIILHKDINWLGGDLYNPHETEKVLDSLDFVKKMEQFGALVIYQIDDHFFAPKIELGNNLSLVYPQKATMRVWPWILNQKTHLISPIEEHNIDNNYRSMVGEKIIFAENSFLYPESSEAGLENIVKSLSTQLTSARGTVQYLKQFGTIQANTENTVNNIFLASQKLIEIFQGKGIDDYANLIEKIIPDLKNNSPLFFDIAQTTVMDILKTHEVLLSIIEIKLNDKQKLKIFQSKNKIREILKNEKLLPLFPVLEEKSIILQRQYFDFWVNEDSNYELGMIDTKISSAYINKLQKMNFQINDRQVTLDGKDIGNSYSYGNIELKKGLNQISFTHPDSLNLINSNNDLAKIGSVITDEKIIKMAVSKNNPVAVESPIFQAAGEDVYQVDFKAQIPANTGLYIQVIQDTDNENNGEKVPRISFLQHLQQTDWQGSISLKLPSLALQTREVKIRIIGLIPPEVNTQNLESIILIEDLKVIRILNNGLFLIQKGLDNSRSADSNIVSFKKINSIEYNGEFRITSPHFLFFKETYHPNWELQLYKNNQKVDPKNHLIGNLFGNAWFVDQPGEYTFKIIFTPQQHVYIGIIITAVGILSLFIYKLVSTKIFKNEN